MFVQFFAIERIIISRFHSTSGLIKFYKLIIWGYGIIQRLTVKETFNCNVTSSLTTIRITTINNASL